MVMASDLCYPDGVGPEQQGVLVITAQELDVVGLFLDAGMLGKRTHHHYPLRSTVNWAHPQRCMSVQYKGSPADGDKHPRFNSHNVFGIFSLFSLAANSSQLETHSLLKLNLY